ncbi:MAG: hypothetical protein ACW979_15145 [Candidatus Thorarchaeota archaeon]|jgi:starvation-inducible outer membrane lipoprotein
MERTFTGSIISAELGNMGKKPYGYISVETEEQEQLRIKVAASTSYDTLDVGERVHIVAETIGNMNMMTAKTVSLVE